MKFSMCMYAHVTDTTPVSNCFILALFVNLPLFATHFTRRTLHIKYRILCLLIDHAVVLPNGNAKAH